MAFVVEADDVTGLFGEVVEVVALTAVVGVEQSAAGEILKAAADELFAYLVIVAAAGLGGA